MNDFIDKHMFEHLKIGVFRYQLSPKGKFIYINRAMLKILGFKSKDEAEKVSLEQLLINKSDNRELLKSIKQRGRVEFFETTAKTVRHKLIWIAITAQYIEGKKKERYIEGIIQDISKYKGANDKIPYMSDSLQTILDSIPDAIYFKDKKNRIMRVNRFYAKAFGGKLEKIIGRTDFDFFPEEQAKQMFADDNLILNTGKSVIGKIEKTLLPNKTWNQVITTKVPLYDHEGKIVGTMGITRDMTPHANMERERFAMVLNALMVLGRALEMRDPYTQSHARDVSVIAEKIGKELHFDENKMTALKIAAELHDLGKIAVPLDILIKPGELSDLEYRLIKEHTTKCYNLIKDIEFPFPLAEIVYQHHERLDGSGYPRHLKTDEILIEAKILAVSDVLEAMTAHRPYRAAMGIKKAVNELKSGMGIKYDSDIVNIVLKILKKNQGEPFWR